MAPKLKTKEVTAKSKKDAAKEIVKIPKEKKLKKVDMSLDEKADAKTGKTPGLKTRFRSTPKKRIGKMPKLKKVRSRIAASIKIKKIRSKDVILVLDFGSQYTQLIARRVRENKVYSKIVPFNITAEEIQEIKPKGLILSGGPMSVYDEGAPLPDKEIFKLDIPILVHRKENLGVLNYLLIAIKTCSLIVLQILHAG